MKKLLTLVACMALVVHLACTSNDAKEDVDSNGELTEEAAGMDAELTQAEADSSAGDSVAEGAADGFLDEQLPEDALGEKVAQEEVPQDPMAETQPPPSMTEEIKPEPVVADSGAPLEEMPAPTDSAMDTMASVDTGGTPPAPTPEVTEPPQSQTDSSTSTLGMGTTGSGEIKPQASLKKVEAMPFYKKGVLLNAVYIARPKDSYKSISKMIYGTESKAKELKKVNPSMSTPKAGNKIYYNSPVRPTDDQKMLTYYEDAGVTPEVYVAQEGDNLRNVASKLLGYEKGWMEIWSLNNVESKGRLTAGTELRYWKSAPSVEAPPVAAEPPAMAMTTPPPQDFQPPPEPQALPPPPDMPMAGQVGSDMPPPPPMPETPPDVAAAPPPPDFPPPPPVDVNPPPPPPVEKKVAKEVVAQTDGMDNDMMMSLAGAGILAAGVAAIIMMRKRRQQKEMSSAFNDTQVGT